MERRARNGSVMALLLVVAACSRGARSNAPAGTVRFAIAADPTTLNPLFLTPDAASVDQQVARLLFEPFVDLDARGHLVPILLREIPTRANGGISADGRTIVYRLRPGVRWSDGVPLTSADVLFTLHAILDPRNPVRTREGYDLIDRAVAPNALTVVLHLRKPWAPAVATFLSYGIEPYAVVPKHILAHVRSLRTARFNGDPSVGDGPYRFVSWQRGDQLTFAANPRYWRGAPRIRRIVARVVADPGTNLTLLRTGELDWNLIAPAQQAALRGARNIRIERVPTSVIAGIAMNVSRGALRDVRVRRAIAESIDRKAISRKITLGVYPVADTLQPSYSWALDPKVRAPGYHPQRADASLRAAGWLRGAGGMRYKNGKPLHLLYVQFPESTTGVLVATFIQQALEARGIAVTLKSVSNAQLFLPKDGTLARGQFDLAYIPWTMGIDPDDSSILRCGAPENYMRWCDPLVDRLERLALETSSRRARKRLYARIEARVASQVPLLVLFDASYLYAYDARLEGFAPNPVLPTATAWAWRVRSAAPRR
ncbi:MAG: peptide ABC transporter substrate-binding protein [Candidatus Eremiobacteraeota bacterium]|nr:peptide ABC transporter substrate-binding protein [Candidatus Eremiobacteraeota bacterium]